MKRSQQRLATQRTGRRGDFEGGIPSSRIKQLKPSTGFRESCRRSTLVAFRCKDRGFCPACGSRAKPRPVSSITFYSKRDSASGCLSSPIRSDSRSPVDPNSCAPCNATSRAHSSLFSVAARPRPLRKRQRRRGLAPSTRRWNARSGTHSLHGSRYREACDAVPLRIRWNALQAHLVNSRRPAHIAEHGALPQAVRLGCYMLRRMSTSRSQHRWNPHS